MNSFIWDGKAEVKSSRSTVLISVKYLRAPLSKTITAAYLGLTSKLKLFKASHFINEYPEEAVSAVIPGVALAELWSMVGSVDFVFRFFNWLIIGISLIGMVTMTLSDLIVVLGS